MRFLIKSPLFISIIFYDDSFIFSVSIIIIIQLCIFFTLRMPKEYYCPRCKSENVFVFVSHIECAECGSSFFIEDIKSVIDEENILAEDELDAFAEAFDEEERKKIKKFLDDDFS
ncbi:MAG: hypothetical protein CEE43_08705 [Promethearchaeota archaeon Loki_b32]|nr:MAG: hypothetical protein CEE43_08705 [Candidatus Lokiarchaeota archaeon Loki_b32]